MSLAHGRLAQPQRRLGDARRHLTGSIAKGGASSVTISGGEVLKGRDGGPTDRHPHERHVAAGIGLQRGFTVVAGTLRESSRWSSR